MSVPRPTDTDPTPRLVPLEIAVRAYPGVTVRMLRDRIRTGRLPATKVGRAYLIDPRDLEALLEPTLRQPPPQPAYESPNARGERQLARAGIRRTA
jgi:excisionase family DNA binding protein